MNRQDRKGEIIESKRQTEVVRKLEKEREMCVSVCHPDSVCVCGCDGMAD